MIANAATILIGLWLDYRAIFSIPAGNVSQIELIAAGGAVILLAVFSLWQMPHSYAIAVFRLDDYLAAAIPFLPVKQGTAAAQKHIIGYILAFTAATLMLTIGGYTGYSTLAVATVLGASWLYLAWWGYPTADERLWAKKLFIFSILTIFTLSVMMSIDFIAPIPPEMLLSYAR